MALQSRNDSIRRPTKSHPNALSDLSPFSTLACQVDATNAWRRDLKSLFSRASERFADVCWTPSENDDDADMTDDEVAGPSWRSPPPSKEGVIWAHKAILYARAPNTFQARFLLLRTPAANLGSIASSSTVSLPVVRAPSPSLSLVSRNSSSARSTKRRTIRGAAPPSSFPMSRRNSKPSTYAGTSDSEADDATRPRMLKRNSSNSSLASSHISRPISRTEKRLSKQISYDSMRNTSSPSLGTEPDALSVISSTSTVKAPMSLDGVNQVFFEATLEYLYTAEESMKEAFEFLYEDRVAADEGPEERLEKLRQDLVFMWRGRLYSDIEIVIGDEEDERTTVRTIPDINASATSLALPTAEEEEETASFSAHRMMLVSRSPYFAAQLLSPYSDSETRIIRLPSPPFTPAALHFTLGFIYTGTLFFSNRTFDLSTAFQLWRSASYLQIDTLSTLVSSLITHDFCHEFTCSPPCKTCVKRVPRTLGFVSCADVSDPHLQSLARNAISGDDFGSYWSKDVGNLDYTVRGALVSDVCSKIDAKPGYAIHCLRQLSMIGTRIDTERNSRWVEAVRWMCESVESHICAIMEAKLPEVIASTEWNKLVEGVGFLNDILEKALSIIVDGLTEKRAAKFYEILVGQVLLREDGLPSNDIVAMVEEARKAIIVYLRKRWVNVRANAGFNGIESWALKELADEIDVPSNDLLLSNDVRASITGPRTRTGLQAKVFPSSDNADTSSKQFAKSGRTLPAPGQIVDGEREAGPIHLRAAVLNRNAARATVAAGSRSASQTSTNPTSSLAKEERSIMSRPRHSMGSTSTGPVASNGESRQALSANVAARSSVSRQTQSSAVKTAPIDRRGSPQPGSKVVVSPPSVAGTSSSSIKTPTASLRSVATSVGSRHDGETTPTKHLSPSVAAFRSSSQQSLKNNSPSSQTSQTSQASQSLKAGEVRKRASEASLRSSPSVTNKVPYSTSSQSISKSVRSRQASTSSAVSTSATSLRKVSASSAASTSAIRKVPSSKSMGQKKREEIPPIPSRTPAVLKSISPNLSPDAMQVDRGETKLSTGQTLSTIAGTQLFSGIPCVIAPRNKDGKILRFRAVVKYIGAVKGEGSKPFVGVEVALPLPSGVEESGYEFHDGMYMGSKYFDIGHLQQQTDVQLSHKPEREARRLRLEQMMQGRQLIDFRDADYVGQEGVRASAKRRKDLSGATLDASPQGSLGLFIRPCEVLWVVI